MIDMNKNRKIILSLILIFTLVISGGGSVLASSQSSDLVDNNASVLIGETTDDAIETPPPEEEPDPPSIIINEYPATMNVGESESLSYTLKNAEDDSVDWDSSDSDVLAVDSNGNATAKSTGTATVTVSAQDTEDSVEITVNEIAAESIKIVSEDFGLTDSVTGHKLDVGDTVVLTVKADPKDATINEITWDVDDSDVAEVDSGGTLVAMKSGTVVVTAETPDGLSDQIEIKIGSDIPWALIAIGAAILLLIIILIILIARKRSRRRPKSGRERYDDDYDDDDDYEDPRREAERRRQEELEKERIRREAYRQGFEERERDMTKVFNPKDFEFKDDDE
jgi:hypothetical protein